jgi:hypothetical protein
MGIYKNSINLKIVADALSNLSEKFVFVGGATVDLYANDPARDEVRPTDDIDVLVEVIGYASYSDLNQKLRYLGFQEDITSTVICRYKYQDIVVDIMPTDGNVLGFTNRWYKEGIQHIFPFRLDPHTIIYLFDIAYFLGSKFEAFKSRGSNDMRLSSDFEDIIYLFDNRIGLLDELQLANLTIRSYLQEEINQLLNHAYIEENIASHLGYGQPAIQRTKRILSIWKEFV